MTTISPITGSNIDGDLNSADFDSLYTMSSVLADISETMTAWYEEAADDLTTASDWMNWLRENAIKYEDEEVEIKFEGEVLDEFDQIFVVDDEDADAIEFTTWLKASGFDYEKYFKFYSNGTVRYINNKYKTEEVLELMGIQVETISSDAEQTSLFAEAIIGDYGSALEELMNMIDTGKGATRGHIR